MFFYELQSSLDLFLIKIWIEAVLFYNFFKSYDCKFEVRNLKYEINV